MLTYKNVQETFLLSKHGSLVYVDIVLKIEQLVLIVVFL